MHVKIPDTRIVEQGLDDCLQHASLDDVSVNHQRVGVVGPHGQEPRSKQLRHVVHAGRRLTRGLPDEDGSRGAVWRIGRLVCERNEQDALTRCSILEADATRETGTAIGDIPLRTPCP